MICIKAHPLPAAFTKISVGNVGIVARFKSSALVSFREKVFSKSKFVDAKDTVRSSPPTNETIAYSESAFKAIQVSFVKI